MEAFLIGGAIVAAALAGISCWYAMTLVRRQVREECEEELQARRYD